MADHCSTATPPVTQFTGGILIGASIAAPAAIENEAFTTLSRGQRAPSTYFEEKVEIVEEDQEHLLADGYRRFADADRAIARECFGAGVEQLPPA